MQGPDSSSPGKGWPSCVLNLAQRTPSVIGFRLHIMVGFPMIRWCHIFDDKMKCVVHVDACVKSRPGMLPLRKLDMRTVGSRSHRIHRPIPTPTTIFAANTQPHDAVRPQSPTLRTRCRRRWNASAMA